MRRTRLPLLAPALAVALVACGSGGSAPPASPSASASAPQNSALPAALRPPIANAAAARDALLLQAKSSPIGTSGGCSSFPEKWAADATAGLQFRGSVLVAESSVVSGGCEFVTSKQQRVSYLAFAVYDAHARCAGGVLVASSDGALVASTSAVTLPRGKPCAGSTVAQAAGYA